MSPQSKSTTDLNIRRLEPGDVEAMQVLEERVFLPAMRASREAMLQRFSLGHTQLGVESEGRLIGMISFAFTHFSPDDHEGFPKTFPEYASQPTAEAPDAICVYNLGVDPDMRSMTCTRLLSTTIHRLGREGGARFIVAEGSPTSYAGNGRVRANPVVREAIDRYLAGGPFPCDDELLQDPTLALYHRLGGHLNPRFHCLIGNFNPCDEASGGHRVFLLGDLTMLDEQASRT